MNAQELLDQLLASAKELASQGKQLASEGKDYASDLIEIPEEGPERDQMIKNLSAGAAAGGLLALLVGTKQGRKVLSPIVKVGSVAALAAVGYKAWEKYQQTHGEPGDGQPENQEQQSLAILQAMMSASKADGHISEEENAAITGQIKATGLQDQAMSILVEQMSLPADAQRIASLARTPRMAVDLYLASLVITSEKNDAEERYLQELADQLKLDPSLVTEIRKEAALVS